MRGVNDMRIRRYLPNLSLLLAFDGVMRQGSVTAAAQELGLTQSTVSRLLQTLEQQMGQPLFVRRRRRLIPTDGAVRYHADISAALDLIQQGGMSLIANPEGGSLDLALLPTFGTRWLAPRLPRFMARHPEVSLNLLTRMTQFDFRQDGMDAAIHFGTPDWPGARMALLFGETVQPLCSPDVLKAYRFKTARDLRQAPLLHLTSRPDAWERWMRQHGGDDIAIQGMLFDQFATLSQAAMSGLGVALLPGFLFEPEIAAGQLVPALPLDMSPPEAYYLCWPHERDDFGPLCKFRDWLIQETASLRDGPKGGAL